MPLPSDRGLTNLVCFLIAFLNIVSFLIAILILFVGILNTKDSTECEAFMYKPFILLGVFLMLLSFTGFIGACRRSPGLVGIYLIFMFIFLLAGVVFTIFTFVETNKGAGRFLSGMGYKEYRLGDYSKWLQKRVNNDGHWNKIKSCLAKSNICNDLRIGNKYSNDTLEKFQKEPLNALQSGCCKPSNECNFTYWYPTFWSQDNGVFTNPDCKAWNNNQTILCYNCQSCKAGFLDTIKDSWKKVCIYNVVGLIYLIIIYSVGCWASRFIMGWE
ncbi:hypothetical protein PTKIN_Ptkin12aG0203000 [Pterospermum kingtungense]